MRSKKYFNAFKETLMVCNVMKVSYNLRVIVCYQEGVEEIFYALNMEHVLLHQNTQLNVYANMVGL